MRRAHVLIAALTLGGLALAGCATVAPAPGTDSGPLTYRCSGGKRFTAAWGLPGDRVKVTAGGATRLLDARPAASGARYGEGPFQIWGKGDEAMLEGFPGGPYTGCRTD